MFGFCLLVAFGFWLGFRGVGFGFCYFGLSWLVVVF